MTLWEFVKTDDDPTVRRHVLEQTRTAIDTMHAKGLFHADLNLHNLLVTEARESFTVIIIDLDKSRLFDSARVGCHASCERNAITALCA